MFMPKFITYVALTGLALSKDPRNVPEGTEETVSGHKLNITVIGIMRLFESY